MKKKFLVTFIISLICFSMLYTGMWKKFLNKDLSATIGKNERDRTEEENEIEPKVKDEILFLMMGIDDQGGIAKVKEKKIEGENKHKPTGNRTDTMMLCKVNFETGEVNILSIPRDTKVKINGRKNEAKINAAHSHGGPYLAVDTVRNLLNIDLNYYVTVDYKAVKEIVDAIGGVEIDVPMNMKYYDPTDKPPLKINLKKGLQVLDGDKAIQFLRFRSGYAEADIGRIKSQQMFMKELVKQTLKPKNILKLPKLVNTYFDYVDTNIPFGVVMQGIGSVNKLDMVKK
jgi:LCP family protein required for cell wall assembly